MEKKIFISVMLSIWLSSAIALNVYVERKEYNKRYEQRVMSNTSNIYHDRMHIKTGVDAVLGEREVYIRLLRDESTVSHIPVVNTWVIENAKTGIKIVRNYETGVEYIYDVRNGILAEGDLTTGEIMIYIEDDFLEVDFLDLTKEVPAYPPSRPLNKPPDP